MMRFIKKRVASRADGLEDMVGGNNTNTGCSETSSLTGGDTGGMVVIDPMFGGEGRSVSRNNSGTATLTQTTTNNHNNNNNNRVGSPIPAGRKRIVKGAGASTTPMELGERQRELDAMILCKKVEELAKFDSCIEACDALAAASHYASASSRKDSQTGLLDCSVLVSPDGDLVLLPSCHNTITTTPTSHDNKNNTNENNKQNKSARYSVNAKLLSELVGTVPDDIESSIYVGSDLQPEGDKSINGFSAKGWSIPATGLALKQTEQSLVDMGNFVEQLILLQKENAGKMSMAVDTVRETTLHKTMDEFTEKEKQLLSPREWELDPIITNDTNSTTNKDPLELTTCRVGPLVYSGSTIYEATLALEQYYATQSETETKRWRLASSAHTGSECTGGTTTNTKMGPLPILRQAAIDIANRASDREKVLEQMVGRANLIESHLKDCQAEAVRRWEAVHEAEELVTKIMEERMMERSKKREQQRLEQFQLQQQQQKILALQQQQSNNNVKTNNNDNNEKSPMEIWDIVSAVTESMEEGSFAPMVLPHSTTTTATTATTTTTSNDNNTTTPAGETTDSTTSEQQRRASQMAPSPAALPLSNEPLVSRADIEQEVNLPELRAIAMAANEVVEDASGSLLNILSNLDTARRSARIAAEASLVSSLNAQAASIRSLIQLEKDSLKEKLKNIEHLEKIADQIDVRSDLDNYITWDRKQRGGASRLGDDDDAGIASALAVLSSHVDGNMGLTSDNTYSNQSSNNESFTSLQLAEITTEQIEDAIDDVFEENPLFQPIDITKDSQQQQNNRNEAIEKLNSSVELLCKIAEDRSQFTKSRQSAICYALNSKRSSCTEIKTKIQFDALCSIFYCIFTGCDCESSSGVSNAKMCMMLAQTFYIEEENNVDEVNDNKNNNTDKSTTKGRDKRIFAKSKLTKHPLWSIEEFWDQTLFQCLSESLTHSGVMANFEMSAANRLKKSRANSSDDTHSRPPLHQQSEWMEVKKIKWHDLTQSERIEAASQVHAVIFAQLGALAHSMIEFGCGLERSCAFVRRMAVRNQLPISQRVVLLQHLMDNARDNEQQQLQQKQPQSQQQEEVILKEQMQQEQQAGQQEQQLRPQEEKEPIQQQQKQDQQIEQYGESQEQPVGDNDDSSVDSVVKVSVDGGLEKQQQKEEQQQ